MNRMTLLTLTALLALAPAALAAGATPEPTPITTCGKLGKGSYVLVNNLNAAGHCLTLQGNFITIDLNGFTITGNGTGSAIRLGTGLSLRAITIRDGGITDFLVGIDLEGASEVLVERMRVVNNESHGILLGTHAIARDNIAEENGGMGFVLGNGGQATGNTAGNNGQRGFTLFSTSIAIGNIAHRNAFDGIGAGEASTIVNNTVTGNEEAGLEVTCPSTVTGNTAVGNNGGNIVTAGAGCHTSHNAAP